MILHLPLNFLLGSISLVAFENTSVLELSPSVSLGTLNEGKYESGCRKYALPDVEKINMKIELHLNTW